MLKVLNVQENLECRCCRGACYKVDEGEADLYNLLPAVILQPVLVPVVVAQALLSVRSYLKRNICV